MAGTGVAGRIKTTESSREEKEEERQEKTTCISAFIRSKESVPLRQTCSSSPEAGWRDWGGETRCPG